MPSIAVHKEGGIATRRRSGTTLYVACMGYRMNKQNMVLVGIVLVGRYIGPIGTVPNVEWIAWHMLHSTREAPVVH